MCCSRSSWPPSSRYGGVDGGLAGIRRCRQRYAGEDGRGQVASGRGQFIDGCAAAGEKAGLLKEVGRRIAADGQLGKDGEPRALVGGAPADVNNFFKISGEIPDRGVDLGECDLHTSSLMQERARSEIKDRGLEIGQSHQI